MKTLQKDPKPQKKVIPIVSDSSQDQMVSLYQSQQKIHPRKTHGRYTNWRWIMVWVTQIIFYGAPWLMTGNRQSILFNITDRQFFIFDLILYPKDLIYLTVILILSALALFLFTTVAGRLWCGFTCPQTVYTKIFLWIEHKIEGDSMARQKLDNSPLNAHKIKIKTLKHAAWILFSMWTGFTFLGYFTPIRDLFDAVLINQLGSWDVFWISFYGFATYSNAGFLREQICKYMCPYARFQSAMFDKDTLIVSYDETRGEPRGGRSKKTDAKSQGKGDCIDCNFCVQVCPVDIDIRDGLQYECISCGLCVDACNNIMDKMEYDRGLIRFSTQNGINHKWTAKKLMHQVLRPRVLIYTGVLLLISAIFVVSIMNRSSFTVNIIRDRGVMARLVRGGNIENLYRLQVTNATEQPAKYEISVKGIKGLSIASKTVYEVKPTKTRMIPISLQLPDRAVKSGSHKIKFKVRSLSTKELVKEPSIFYMPR